MPLSLQVSISDAMMAQVRPPPSEGLHNAGLLGSEAEVTYPFHPLFRRTALVVADQFHNGMRHLTLRTEDGSSFMVPAWMTAPEAASVEVVASPRLPVERLLELRTFLDSVLASSSGETPRNARRQG